MKKHLPLPSRPLRVGVVQTSSGENISDNVRVVIAALEKFRGAKCNLICFPENVLYLRVNKNKKVEGEITLKEKFWSEFSKLAGQLNSTLVFGSVALKKGKKLANATILVTPNKKPKAVYEKIHLFDVDVEGAPASRESDFFVHGKRPAMLKLEGWNVGLSICYDVRFAELYLKYARQNAHLILVPAAFLVPTGKAHWHTLLRARAIESQCFVIAAAQVGGHKSAEGHTRDTFGHSLVVGPWGEVLEDLGGQSANQKVIELNPAEMEHVRRQIPMSHHRRLK